MSSRRKRSPEEQARRDKIRELLQSSGVSSMEDIQTVLHEFRNGFLEEVLDVGNSYRHYQLLFDEYATLWNGVLYGVGQGDGEIVSVALSQVGNVGGEPYWSYMGFTSRVDWCACFVSWCANECGYIESGVMPNFS